MVGQVSCFSVRALNYKSRDSSTCKSIPPLISDDPPRINCHKIGLPDSVSGQRIEIEILFSIVGEYGDHRTIDSWIRGTTGFRGMNAVMFRSSHVCDKVKRKLRDCILGGLPPALMCGCRGSY